MMGLYGRTRATCPESVIEIRVDKKGWSGLWPLNFMEGIPNYIV